MTKRALALRLWLDWLALLKCVLLSASFYVRIHLHLRMFWGGIWFRVILHTVFVSSQLWISLFLASWNCCFSCSVKVANFTSVFCFLAAETRNASSSGWGSFFHLSMSMRSKLTSIFHTEFSVRLKASQNGSSSSSAGTGTLSGDWIWQIGIWTSSVNSMVFRDGWCILFFGSGCGDILFWDSWFTIRLFVAGFFTRARVWWSFNRVLSLCARTAFRVGLFGALVEVCFSTLNFYTKKIYIYSKKMKQKVLQNAWFTLKEKTRKQMSEKPIQENFRYVSLGLCGHYDAGCLRFR